MAAISTGALIAISAISAGTKVTSAYMQSRANNKAIEAQEKASKEALAFEQKQLEQSRADAQPFRDYTLAQLGLGGAGGTGATATGTPVGAGVRFTGPTPDMMRTMFPKERAVPGLTRDARGGRIGPPIPSYTVAQLSGRDPAYSNYAGAPPVAQTPGTPVGQEPGTPGALPGDVPLSAMTAPNDNYDEGYNTPYNEPSNIVPPLYYVGAPPPPPAPTA
jgi:hypothetical protein